MFNAYSLCFRNVFRWGVSTRDSDKKQIYNIDPKLPNSSPFGGFAGFAISGTSVTSTQRKEASRTGRIVSGDHCRISFSTVVSVKLYSIGVHMRCIWEGVDTSEARVTRFATLG